MTTAEKDFIITKIDKISPKKNDKYYIKARVLDSKQIETSISTIMDLELMYGEVDYY